MKTTSSYILAGLIAQGLFSLPAAAQNPPGQPPAGRPGQDQAALVKQVEDTMMSFVRSSATMAGAVSVCSPPEAVVIHDCSMLILKNWNNYSRQPPIGDAEFWKQVSATWGTYSVGAHNMQVKEHPISCSDIMASEQQSKIFKICSRPPAAGGDGKGTPGGIDMTPGTSPKPGGVSRPAPSIDMTPTRR